MRCATQCGEAARPVDLAEKKAIKSRSRKDCVRFSRQDGAWGQACVEAYINAGPDARAFTLAQAREAQIKRPWEP